MTTFTKHSAVVRPAFAPSNHPFSKVHLLSAIQKARDSGYKHFTAALVTIYKKEYPNK